MKKKIAIAAVLVTLLINNVATANFSDEYKAKYPKRVKITTEQARSGKTYTKTAYKLFDRKLQSGRLKLDLEMNTSGPDLCFLHGVTGNRPTKLKSFIPVCRNLLSAVSQNWPLLPCGLKNCKKPLFLTRGTL